ncbi:E3 ubiquitin-protein ligase PRT6 [Cucurbita pepo subsp. pepo]|uniref:E3 ubiquitin-protein ligase PRT6 n=1 Tax=Cucurbita pepo subsp. pepo TaxID=3664 RepID=UPI000C9D67B8|nr:E3 ubiquitin-protein ligase PRT6 [Cucurbita pepo subsp. pepo]XP_023528609.1 E3 ubiquitin-protein ligase PRT6 [Cucurbita pepo subsp. pepo]XP_023528610.1 E3 ubiquitin-protein ligase PRT6 [Cucurbita pepo subsp. pepo]XP_023528611.1 E3 ubiquitin-protein ligase PRT6 [Cucurbita pepo subsp. pepo]
MDDMDIGSPSESAPLKPRDRILRRLAVLGVPDELLDQLFRGLVSFVKDNKFLIPQLVSAILPTDVEVVEVIRDAKAGSKKSLTGPTMKTQFRESMMWLQWLMFEGEPAYALKNLSKMSIGQRGVCGAVWGHNDIAYRCRTCEHDPTCAICVPCFQSGNHQDHDYSIIYTGGGCCDCGDATAWKREGFCSKHKGAEQIQPLPEEFVKSVGPILDALFTSWKNKLLSAEDISVEDPKLSDRVTEHKKVANELTFAVVEMLLDFCKYSESLLSFVSKRVISSAGLLDILVRLERLLNDSVVKKVHELLLKLLGEPIFKYEFAKVFLNYYPTVISEAIEDSSDHALKKYPLLPTFSVQIFTVPTLTPCLVEEMNLLSILLGCLEDIFISCVSEDGRLQVIKWSNLYETTIRVVEDVRFVMSHAVVPRYVIYEQQDILRTWLRLLTFVQGMDPQKRETGLHIEEENENVHLPFGLDHSVANIHSLLVKEAFSPANSSSREDTADAMSFQTYKQNVDDIDNVRHAKVGRLSQETAACNVLGKGSRSTSASRVDEVCLDKISPTIMWLTYECLKIIDSWLATESTYGSIPNMLDDSISLSPSCKSYSLRKTSAPSKMEKGKFIFEKLAKRSKYHIRQYSSRMYSGLQMSIDNEHGISCGEDSQLMDVTNDTVTDEDYAMEVDALHSLSSSAWPNIVYDVSSQDISIHIPLHRLLSLLLQKALGSCFSESVVLSATGASSSNLSSEYMDFFKSVLTDCHPYGFSSFVMEHPLRIKVFCAEVNAGMWRRNGDAALLSCELYRSIRWSEQCLELDLFLLQCCAAMAPPDLYVSRIIERFRLSDYISLNVERPSEYEPTLVQEMLTLIIQIVNERRFCGLTVAESLKRELIYKLAIGDATHSQLVKALPRDLSKCHQLQEILDTIAVYSNPSGFNQGMYSLHWKYWKELDLYHPRWSLRDLQVAEERYLRSCSVSALTSQLPKWTKTYPPFKGLARIATCKTVLQFVRAVLFYSVFTEKSTKSRAPDSVLLSALHLLALALDICFQQKESSDQSFYGPDSIPLLLFAAEEIDEGLAYGFGRQSLLSLLILLMKMHKKEGRENFLEAGSCNLSSLVESLLKKFSEVDSHCMGKVQQLAPEILGYLSESLPSSNSNRPSRSSDSEKRKAKARERQAAILEKMRAEQSKFLASVDASVDDDDPEFGQESEKPDVSVSAEQSETVCSLCHDSSSSVPISFLTLLQKSKLVSLIDRGVVSWDQPYWRDEHASTMSKRNLDQSGLSTSSASSGGISSLQLTELIQNAVKEYANHGLPGEVGAFLDFVKSHFPPLRNSQVPGTSNDKGEKIIISFDTLEEDIYLSVQKEMHDSLHSKFYGDEIFSEVVRGEDSMSVLHVKYIAALSRELAENHSTSVSAHNVHTLVEHLQPTAFNEIGPTDCDGIYLSSCGHAVHQGCLDRYLSSLKERFARRIVFEGGHIVDPEQGEFLCPVCRRLANCTLPAYPRESQNIWNPATSSVGSLSRVSGHLNKSTERGNPLYIQQAVALLQSAAKAVGRNKVLKDISVHGHRKVSHDLEVVSLVLSKMYFSEKQDKLISSSRINPSILMWDMLKYSLISMEIAARSKTDMNPNIGLNTLYKELKTSGGFVLSLLLKVIQRVKCEDSLLLLQRFCGIQRFADSICSGMSNENASDSCGRGILHILTSLRVELPQFDIQFLSRGSDPVLAHDPFASLMWVLFCLPFPFLSCRESLLSLVHIFYLVSVAQAIISSFIKSQCKVDELGFSDSLVADICKIMEESEYARQYFVSNYTEPSCNVKDMIRSLTFPYLRRCALLLKLLNSCALVPIFYGETALETYLAGNNMIDNNTLELNEIEKLEKMFEILPLDIVFKDGTSRALVSKWFCHFNKEFELQRSKNIKHCTPAVPFQLIRLPHVYHDLLQRYIKKRCPDCKHVIDDPALCLLCGRLCSPSWKSCCRESGCQAHANICAAGTGVFLLIRRTTILLQRSARQAPWPSPYLDAFGEEDIEMRRGKPLYLNEERYAALSYMVACHGLDRSSKVLGQTTIGSIFMI